VRIAGLEPANWVLSSLLIVAIRCFYLLVSIHIPCRKSKHYIASMSNDGKKYLCQPVSGIEAVSECVGEGLGLNLCQPVSGAPLTVSLRYAVE
jgi:hypothetical protein